LNYCHFDVQPVEPLNLWKSNPFKMTIRNGKIYARGVSDSKGHLFAYIKGVESILKKEGKLPINIKFVVDGDEEAVQLALPELIKTNPEKLKADAVLIGAGAMIKKDAPSICYAVRGLVSAEIEVKTLENNLHSGSYGGGVLNAAEYLVKILADVKDENGRIAIPKFYQKVVSVSKKDSPLSIYDSEKEFLKSGGAKKVFGEKGFSLHEMIVARPTFEINGISGGFAEEGFQFIIPAKAIAKVSFRLAQNQNSKEVFEMFEKFVLNYKNDVVEISIKQIDSAEPAIMNRESFVAKKAAESLEKIFGKKTVWYREGGAVPVVNDFQKIGKDVIMVGFGLPDDNIHAPNEKLDLDNFYKEIEFSAEFVKKLAEY
jgi:acetylornithine deacetylase/succinyl-diaminopimelate desuccinylase-like protein